METQNKNHPERVKRRKKKWRIIIILLGVLLCVRIAMPYVILHYANKKLATLDGYYGHVEDVDLWLFRGAYVIKDIYIDKVDSTDKRTEFFVCPRIDLSVEWKAIWQKKIVGEVIFEQARVNYVMDETIGKEAEDDSTNFIQLIKDFMPLRINRFEVVDGEIHYMDLNKSPKVDVPMTEVNIVGEGLTNEQDTAVLPASIKMDANLYDGKFTVNTKLAPLNDAPTFDLNATMTNTNLTHFNDFFKAYAKCDVETGTMSMYTEVAAKDGAFTGYVKPLIKDLKVLSLKEDGGPVQIVWEGLVGGITEVLSNQPKDQFATKVELNGKFNNPDVDIIEAIVTMLQNAFIQALRPSLDNDVSLETVDQAQPEEKGFIDRLFDKESRDNREDNRNKRKERRRDKE
jgi:hypothetical protein